MRNNKIFLILAVMSTFVCLLLAPSSATHALQCPDGGPTLPDSSTIADCPNLQDNSGDGTNRNLQPGDIDCEITPLTSDNCEIIRYIVVAINFLTAIAGIAFVASIMIAGFQYMTARDNAGQIQKAKSRIVMTLVALGIYIFMYALLNFLVPGGVLPT